jgi:hypothetical protein
MDDSRDSRTVQANAVAEYKRILSEALDLLPSGTRKRLAAALGKNRSFISQISNPAYSVPIPARHVDALLDLSHLPPDRRAAFLAAYHRAHPHWRHHEFESPRLREVTVLLPDLGDSASNRELETLVRALAQGVGRLAVHQTARAVPRRKVRKARKETPA